MGLHTVVQRACSSPTAPANKNIRSWAKAAYEACEHPESDKELTIRLVDENEAGELNRAYRRKDYATNVLSFPGADESFDTGLLGDIVICPAVVEREALEQHKALEAHWSHMVVHGVLHLCGHEHDTDAGARRMESREKRILAGFGFPDPYTVSDE